MQHPQPTKLHASVSSIAIINPYTQLVDAPGETLRRPFFLRGDQHLASQLSLAQEAGMRALSTASGLIRGGGAGLHSCRFTQQP
jgi:hypothetical protein